MANDDLNQPAGGKRKYRPPQLLTYGDLRVLTQAGSKTPNENNSDGGGCPKTGNDLKRSLNPNCT